MMKLGLAVAVVGLFATTHADNGGNFQNYDQTNYDYKVVQLELSPAEVKSLRDEKGYDFWKLKPSRTTKGKFVAEVMMPRSESLIGDIIDLAKRSNVVTLVDDIAELVKQDRQRIEKKLVTSANWTAKRGDDTFFETYRPYADHRRFLLELAEENSNTVELLPSLGKTWEGRDIPVVHIKSPQPPSGRVKPAIYLQSTVHAREWLATTSLAWTMKTLAEGYRVDPIVTMLLDELDFYITPIVNIDGYIYTWETNRLWRKNRRNNGGGSYGVDINRNWGPESTWCTAGSSTTPSSDTYCGAYAFSEPETEACGKFIDEHPEIASAVDFHTYGPYILWPYQYTYDQIPQPDFSTIELLAQAMGDAINADALPDYRYVPMQGSDLYPHSGGMIDYCYDLHDIYAFTFEGRGQGFTTPDSDIIPAGAEQWQGIATMAAAAAQKTKQNVQQQ